jgi:hypothetical protein
MTIAQEFSLALVEDRAEQDSFKPLIAKFEELKEVLQSNFKMKRKHRKWYGAVTWEVLSAINLELVEKISHSSGKYLFIRINGKGYVMGLGEIGELKDRLYFIEGKIIMTSQDKITNVQLFVDLIKTYRNYLVG